jgi:hypothetical protein
VKRQRGVLMAEIVRPFGGHATALQASPRALAGSCPGREPTCPEPPRASAGGTALGPDHPRSTACRSAANASAKSASW